MDYTPRYSQPFTLAQAVLFDVAVINEEIGRLQNSLNHLRRTQGVLAENLAASSTPDPDIQEAFEENKIVIGSQEERVSMLQMALSEKGVSSHYDLGEVSRPDDGLWGGNETTEATGEGGNTTGVYL